MPKLKLAPWQYAAVHSPFIHTAFLGGVATGKTYTGAHFTIAMIQSHPELTGLVGANQYDQLSGATLRELFYWFDYYGMQYVIDKRPPPEWGAKVQFKDYHNILSVRWGRYVTTIFVRILSQGNPLRGIEFSWYWIDETSFTPEDTHNVLIARMRESDFMKGLITTTTFGQNWVYKRFVEGNSGDGVYGAMHIPTKMSLDYGIIKPAYYNVLRNSYSPQLAAQELDALHVNVLGGRAYYASSEANHRYRAPWGDAFPNPDRPLVVACDFNYQPAPHIWMIGQVGPALYGPQGQFWAEHIHWYGELSGVALSSEEMANRLCVQYPGFFFQVFGDASGNKGTTSNAGEHDYNKMAMVFGEHSRMFTIDVEQCNPLVRNRVENMNALCCNALGMRRLTYNPMACPNFKADLDVVGWKVNHLTGKAMLDNGGNVNRTHASDGAGYAVFKLFPPGRTAQIVGSVISGLRKDLGYVMGTVPEAA